jgi:hypothetical protein
MSNTELVEAMYKAGMGRLFVNGTTRKVYEKKYQKRLAENAAEVGEPEQEEEEEVAEPAAEASLENTDAGSHNMEPDVFAMSNADLVEAMYKAGMGRLFVNGTTRKVYEKKYLQKLAAQALPVPEAEAEPEPEPEPESEPKSARRKGKRGRDSTDEDGAVAPNIKRGKLTATGAAALELRQATGGDAGLLAPLFNQYVQTTHARLVVCGRSTFVSDSPFSIRLTLQRMSPYRVFLSIVFGFVGCRLGLPHSRCIGASCAEMLHAGHMLSRIPYRACRASTAQNGRRGQWIILGQ